MTLDQQRKLFRVVEAAARLEELRVLEESIEEVDKALALASPTDYTVSLAERKAHLTQYYEQSKTLRWTDLRNALKDLEVRNEP